MTTPFILREASAAGPLRPNAVIVQIRISTPAFAVDAYCKKPFRFGDITGQCLPVLMSSRGCVLRRGLW